MNEMATMPRPTITTRLRQCVVVGVVTPEEAVMAGVALPSVQRPSMADSYAVHSGSGVTARGYSSGSVRWPAPYRNGGGEMSCGCISGRRKMKEKPAIETGAGRPKGV